MVENAWNVSIRKTFDIPRQTHRYLIQPLSEVPHLKTILIRKFLSFIGQLEKCPKKIVGNLLRLIKHDVNSTTGANLRQISMLCNKNNINDLNTNDADMVEYHPIPEDELWRVNIIRDIIDARQNNTVIEGFSIDELDGYMDFVCTS